MISIDQIKNFYPDSMSGKAVFQKHIIKEYIQLLVLDYLSSKPCARKITFIGGTNLRLVKGIDRFSEDLDFDCKDFSEEEFISMSKDIVEFLRRSDFAVEVRNKDNSRLTAYSSSIHFPELLFELGISGHRDERFMLKLEAQDQKVFYEPNLAFVKGCGFFFSFPVPPDSVLCAMKISALLARGKGRDFYDVIFLMSQTNPDYQFLKERCGIHNLEELKTALKKSLKSTQLDQKQKDFEHLLFNRENSRRILHFEQFVNSL